MSIKVDYWPPVGRKQKLAILAILALIVFVAWGRFIYHEYFSYQQSREFAEEIKRLAKSGFVMVEFQTGHSPDQRKRCFSVREKDKLDFIANAMALVDTEKYLVPTQWIMSFTVNFEAADGQIVQFLGKVVESAPRHVYLKRTYFIRDEKGRWQPEGQIGLVRIPEFSLWTMEQYAMNGCEY